MQPVTKSRRLFLRAAALAGAGVGLAAAGPALAFRLLPADDFSGVIENACTEESQVHAKVLADIQKELGIQLSEEEAKLVLAQLRCPSCGCSMLEAASKVAPDQSGF